MAQEEWEHLGPSDGMGALFGGPYHDIVRNKKTGQAREIYRMSNQSIGEAIEKSQFTKRDVSHMNK